MDYRDDIGDYASELGIEAAMWIKYIRPARMKRTEKQKQIRLKKDHPNETTAFC